MSPNDAMHLICGNNYNWLLNLNLIYETLWNGTGSGLLISMPGRVSWFHLTGLVTLLLNRFVNGFVLEEKSSFKIMGIDFSSKLDWGPYIISIVKTASSLDSFHEVAFS